MKNILSNYTSDWKTLLGNATKRKKIAKKKIKEYIYFMTITQ